MSTPNPTATGTAPNLSMLRIVLGVVCLALGIAVLAWPVLTLLIVAVLFGVQLLIAGLVRFILARRSPLTGGRRTLTLVLAVFTVIAGLICIIHPGTSLLVIIWAVALGWFADGISELAAGIATKQSTLQRATMIFFGISSVIGAVLVLTFPGASLLLFNQIGGVLLLIFGAITLATAIRARRPRTTTA